MTAQSDPYVRVYYRVIDDPKFKEVFDNDARLACWLRLLLIADATYPMPAPVPAGVKRPALTYLVEVGLVDLEPGGRYRIHGMDPERSRRSALGEAAARKRWDADALRTHSGRNANPMQGPNANPMHSEPSRAYPSRAFASNAAALPGEGPNDRHDERRLVGGFTAEERRIMAEKAAAAIIVKDPPEPDR
jgi:hypothetical protein